ncbi:MAG: hypothetical protein O2U61_05435 [Candidatus Bathyarchaeota archaeon]|jgi:Tol biopolymer transport system component|nr:hypothetical protein [Candidatus Bathyarchaeota archaeon]
MKQMKNLAVILILGLFLLPNCFAQNNFPVLKGAYLGQIPPGNTAVLFAPGLLSDDTHSPLGIAVSPDGKEIFYTLFSGPGKGTIVFTKEENGKWIKPQATHFSGEYQDWDLNLSPDGKTLYFSSFRPASGSAEQKKDADIWFVKKDSKGRWGKPKNPGSPVNSNMHEVHPTIADNGNIYFFSREGKKQPDIYMSKFINGSYTKPEKLGDSINTKYNDADPFIAPDESYIIFQSKRPGGFGANDLYISYRKEDGTWSNSMNMGPKINTEVSDYCGRVSHDGKYLFFSRSKAGTWISDFYWIDAKIIEDLKPKDLEK